MNIAQLIEKLNQKDQSAEVEYIICKADGEIIAMKVEKQTKPIINMLKWFKKGESK